MAAMPCPHCNALNPTDACATRFEMTRGVVNPARAKGVGDLPQRVRVEFDRGRITVAASLEVRGKPGSLHSDMLLALAQSLDRLVAQDFTPSEARLPWNQIAHEIKADTARRRRRSRIIVVLLTLFIIGMIGIGVTLL